jgi:hypothetical protein
MQTTDLIATLAADLRPTPRRASLRRLVAGVSIGAVVAVVAVVFSLGLRSNLASILLSSAFWMKWGLALGVGAVALGLCVRLARPEASPGLLPGILMVPVLALGAMALFELGTTPAGNRLELWMGHSALHCPLLIAGFAVPVFVGVLWALRRFAPTRPRMAGFSAGCLAGATAAAVYAIHCNETAAAFVVTWYSAGILLPAALGALIGPRVLRW